MIDKLFHHGGDDAPASPAPAPVAPKPTTSSAPAAPAVVPDPLSAPSTTPIASASAASVSDPLATSSALPSWMSPSAPAPAPDSISDPLALSSSAPAEMPAWLKPAPSPQVASVTETPDLSQVVTPPSETLPPSGESVPVTALPSWLQPPAPSDDPLVAGEGESGTTPESAPLAGEIASPLPSWLQGTATSSPESDSSRSDSSPSSDVTTQSSTPDVLPPSSEIPSWLQNASADSSS